VEGIGEGVRIPGVADADAGSGRAMWWESMELEDVEVAVLS
jgi:hypothetical protein